MKFIDRAKQDLEKYKSMIYRFGNAKDIYVKLCTAVEMADKNKSDKQLGVAYKDAISELYKVKSGPELRQILTETFLEICNKTIETIDFIPAQEIEELQIEVNKIKSEKNELMLVKQNYELKEEKHKLEIENINLKLQFEQEKNKILEEKFKMSREANEVLATQNEKYEKVINSITGLMQQLLSQSQENKSSRSRSQFFTNPDSKMEEDAGGREYPLPQADQSPGNHL